MCQKRERDRESKRVKEPKEFPSMIMMKQHNRIRATLAKLHFVFPVFSSVQFCLSFESVQCLRAESVSEFESETETAAEKETAAETETDCKKQSKKKSKQVQFVVQYLVCVYLHLCDSIDTDTEILTHFRP